MEKLIRGKDHKQKMEGGKKGREEGRKEREREGRKGIR